MAGEGWGREVGILTKGMHSPRSNSFDIWLCLPLWPVQPSLNCPSVSGCLSVPILFPLSPSVHLSLIRGSGLPSPVLHL